jgi:hypothetical protein
MKKLGLLVFAIALISSLTIVSYVSGKSLVPNVKIFKQIRGSGVVKTERRNVPAFRAVDAGGAIEIEVVAGREQSVELEGDDNILQLIRTEVRGETLHIERENGNYRMKNKIRVRISVQELSGFDLSGASVGTISNVRSENFKLQVSGASRVRIDGEARVLDLDASGASSIDAENLRVERATVEASGATRATVFVSDSLDAEASGASRIIYAGNPKTLNKDTSGASSVSAK